MIRAEPGRPWQPGPGWRGLFCQVAGSLQTGADPADTTAIPALSLAWSDDAGAPWVWQAAADDRAWWLHLEAPAPATVPTLAGQAGEAQR
jgi:hypothetical protein